MVGLARAEGLRAGMQAVDRSRVEDLGCNVGVW
jgi:hypothetical protein